MTRTPEQHMIVDLYQSVRVLPIPPDAIGPVICGLIIARAIDGKRIAPVVEETVSDILRKAGLIK